MEEYILKSYFFKYLKEVRKLSDSSVKHYDEAMRYISKYLIEKSLLEDSIYEIQDIDELESIRAYLYNDIDFMALDKRGHQMYTAGFNTCYRFAEGEDFEKKKEDILVLDIEVPVIKQRERRLIAYSRSSIIKKQTLEVAGYKCEINPTHKTFIAKSTDKQYMEGHHLLPLKLQEHFDNSLDVYANVVCLCPICHRLMHYGLDSEKKISADKMYDARRERLAKSGFKLSKDEFERLVI